MYKDIAQHEKRKYLSSFLKKYFFEPESEYRIYVGDLQYLSFIAIISQKAG